MGNICTSPQLAYAEHDEDRNGASPWLFAGMPSPKGQKSSSPSPKASIRGVKALWADDADLGGDMVEGKNITGVVLRVVDSNAIKLW